MVLYIWVEQCEGLLGDTLLGTMLYHILKSAMGQCVWSLCMAVRESAYTQWPRTSCSLATSRVSAMFVSTMTGHFVD